MDSLRYALVAQGKAMEKLEAQVIIRNAITQFDPEKHTEEQVIDIINKAVKVGADPREHCEFPLRIAAMHGLLLVVKHLIKKYKADDSVYQFEALTNAIDGDHLDVARFLAKRMKSQLLLKERRKSPTF
jgi:hypothetical protein